MAKKKRFAVVAVKMYDVVDTETGEIIYNTRDRGQAVPYANEHEKLYNLGGDGEVHEAH